MSDGVDSTIIPSSQKHSGAFRVWQNCSNGVRSVRENCGECASKVWVKCRESAGKVGANWANSNDNVMMELFKIE